MVDVIPAPSRGVSRRRALTYERQAHAGIAVDYFVNAPDGLLVVDPPGPIVTTTA